MQVEFFHPNSDREPGDSNIEWFGLDVHPVVFPVSLMVIVAFVAATILLGERASEVYNAIFT